MGSVQIEDCTDLDSRKLFYLLGHGIVCSLKFPRCSSSSLRSRESSFGTKGSFCSVNTAACWIRGCCCLSSRFDEGLIPISFLKLEQWRFGEVDRVYTMFGELCGVQGLYGVWMLVTLWFGGLAFPSSLRLTPYCDDFWHQDIQQRQNFEPRHLRSGIAYRVPEDNGQIRAWSFSQC